MSKKMKLSKWNNGWAAGTYRLICQWAMMKRQLCSISCRIKRSRRKSSWPRLNTQQLLREKMEQFAGALKDKELVIFRERLLNEEPLTLREIGEKYDISRERVRQIEERVKRKLKAFLSKELKDIKSPSRLNGLGSFFPG